MIPFDVIRDWAGEKHYIARSNSSSPRLLIFGESHYFIHRRMGFIDAQIEAVRKFKPRYILHELLGQETRKLEQPDWNKAIADGLAPFNKVAEEINAELLGCDLLGSEDDLDRERFMGKTMSEHAHLSDRPVVAVLGAHHTHRLSAIHPVLSSQKVPYCTVDQIYIDRASSGRTSSIFKSRSQSR